MQYRQSHRTAGRFPFHLFFLAAILLFAALLRFYKLGEWNFWIDELFTIRDAINHDHLRIFDVFQVKAPSQFDFRFTSVSLSLVRAALEILGIHEWSARLVAVLFGLLTIPMLYIFTRRVLNAKVALWSVLFLAISPWHLFLSQNARYYTPLIFFFTLSFFAFYFSLEKNNLIYFGASILALALAVLERVHVLFFVPVIALYLITLFLLRFEKPAGVNRTNLFLFIAVPAAVYLAYEFYNVVLLRSESFLATFLSPQFLGLTTSSPRWLLTNFITDLGMPLVILAVAGSYFLLREKSRIGLLLALNAVVPIVVLMAMAPFFQTFNHYAMISLPSWVILGATGLVKLYQEAGSRRGALVIAGATLATLLLFGGDRVMRDILHYLHPSLGAVALLLTGVLAAGLAVHRLPVRKCPGDWLLFGLVFVALAHPLAADSLYFSEQHAYRDNLWRWAMQVVRAEKAPGDAVISVMSPVASYYLGEKVEDLDKTDPDVFLQNGKRVWIVDVFGVYRSREKDYGGWVEENCKLVDSRGRYLRGQTVTTHVQLCERGN